MTARPCALRETTRRAPMTTICTAPANEVCAANKKTKSYDTVSFLSSPSPTTTTAVRIGVFRAKILARRERRVRFGRSCDFFELLRYISARRVRPGISIPPSEMATRTREIENVGRVSGATRADRSYADMEIEAREPARADNSGGGGSGDSDTLNAINTVPHWLRGMRPIVWKTYGSGDCNAKKRKPRGRNCCLFAPLNECASQHIVNGFCMYHLRTIFNVVYHIESTYVVQDGQARVLSHHRSFVADPQPVNNEITAVFPIFEMFPEIPDVGQIKLHHFARYLQNSNIGGWEGTYAKYVNFLHNLITLRQHMPNSEAEHKLNNMLTSHWTDWNEQQSWDLKNTPATLYIYYARDGNVQTAPIGGFTTLTQQVCRLFSLPYSSIDHANFFPMLPCYGFHVRGHLSYLNNLCSSGTTVSESGLQTLGNIATLQIMRTDKNHTSLLHWSGESSGCKELCVDTRIDPKQISAMSHMAAATTNKRGATDDDEDGVKRARGA